MGDATVRPSLRTVEGPDGSAKGEPRVIQVLVALADARGQVLSREDLLRDCWGGRIVGDDAINRAIAAVRRLAADSGAAFEVETVPRIGYRLTGIDWSEPPVEDQARSATPAIDRRALLAGGSALVLSGVGGWWALAKYRTAAEVDELVERGRILQGSGKPAGDAQAASLFRRAIGIDGQRADAWGWLAVVLDDYAQARDAAHRALEIDPTEPNARAVLAYQRRDLDAWTRWEDTLLSILDDAPGNAVALNQLTFFYQGMGRCRDSLAMNERALAEEPFNPLPQHRRAMKHYIFGRQGEADKVIDQAMRLSPRNPGVWNTRMVIYAFTDRAPAALALLDDVASRPPNLTAPSVASWRAALTAIASRAPEDVAQAIAVCTRTASLAPGLAANAIMAFSYLGEVDAAYRVSTGLFEARGPVVQVSRSGGIKDLYSVSNWGRTQFLFIPAMERFRSDPRFVGLCRSLGHVDYWRQRKVWPDPFVRGVIDPKSLA